MKRNISFLISPEEVGERLDVVISKRLGDISRNQVKKLIQSGFVKVNGKISKKPSYKVKRNDDIEVTIPPNEELELEPQDVPFEIIYEDEHIAVIEKPYGIVVHPAPGHKTNTLVHGLLKRLKGLSGIGGKLRPGIVHRLDKDTSGIMIVAKNDQAHQRLTQSFKNREISKTYAAIVYKVPEKTRGTISAPIGRHPVHRKKMTVLKNGREATTQYEVIEKFRKAALLHLKPITGRTHQLRVHMSYIGHPILGDPIYGGQKPDVPKAPRLMLHAFKLELLHPITGKPLNFEVPMPPEFIEYIKLLRGKASD